MESPSIEELIRTYSPFAYKFIRRITNGDEALTADILQESFIKCWRNKACFDTTKSSLKTWVLTICYRTALDHIRKNNTRRRYETAESNRSSQDTSTPTHSESTDSKSLDSEFQDLSPLPDTLFELSERKELIEKAVASLRTEYKTVIVLHHEANLTFTEMSEITGISSNTLKSQYRRSLEELRTILIGYGIKNS
jgi:RNA polymerase sigma-70 factor, ECF subfamily